MTTSASDTRPSALREAPPGPARKKNRRTASYIFLTIAAIFWITPVAWTLYTSLRPVSDTDAHGYFSLAHTLTLENYQNAWVQGDIIHYFLNSVYITVPAVLVTLLLSSSAAFVLSRFSFKFNLTMLLLFTAGNLLPQQVFLAPLFKVYLWITLPDWLSSSGHLYDSILGLVVINVSFQMGFATFVLSNFMKAIPTEITEAALVDGASAWTQYWKLTLPLARPALAAMGTLLTIWIYNDFFWAVALISTGSKYPITTAILNLKGTYAVNNNLLAAGALIIAVPTLVVYAVLQKQFISGLTLGSTKA
ncbi:MAG: carbohydrate ABC transporter permease [Nakamurella sp.]